MSQKILHLSGELGDGSPSLIKSHLMQNGYSDALFISCNSISFSTEFSVEANIMKGLQDQKTLDSLASNAPLLIDVTSASERESEIVLSIVTKRRMYGINLPVDKPVILFSKDTQQKAIRFPAYLPIQCFDRSDDLLKELL